MKIAATYVINADVEAWARIQGVSVDEAEAEIFAFLGRLNPVQEQSLLTLDSAAIAEDTL